MLEEKQISKIDTEELNIDSREYFNDLVFINLTSMEISLINPNIYLNPEYIEYWQNYKMEMYDWCFKFLIKNKKLLRVAKTPSKFKKQLKSLIASHSMLKPKQLLFGVTDKYLKYLNKNELYVLDI